MEDGGRLVYKFSNKNIMERKENNKYNDAL